MINKEIFKKMLEEATETSGGTGLGTETTEQTTNELKAIIEQIKKENAKEINSLKSQLGHANKMLEDYQKNGKTAEEIAQLEKEKLEKELKEIKDKYILSSLEAKKNELVSQNKIKSQFAHFIKLSPEMSETDLENLIKEISAKQKEFETEFLKEYSITNAGFNPKSKNNNETDFVDKIVEKNKNNIVDLTKI